MLPVRAWWICHGGRGLRLQGRPDDVFDERFKTCSWMQKLARLTTLPAIWRFILKCLHRSYIVEAGGVEENHSLWGFGNQEWGWHVQGMVLWYKKSSICLSSPIASLPIPLGDLAITSLSPSSYRDCQPSSIPSTLPWVENVSRRGIWMSDRYIRSPLLLSGVWTMHVHTIVAR